MDIEDNGVGMPAPVDYATLLREGHLGLAGMRQRADRIGATIDILPATAAGTVVSLHVPVAPTGTGDVLR